MTGEETDWHQPGRPTHPHFTALSLTVLAIDAHANENPGSTRIPLPGGATVNLDDLGDRPQVDTEAALAAAGADPEGPPSVPALAACWHVGLNAGLSETRGISLSNPFLQPMTATIDRESMFYMARARATHALREAPGERRTATLGEAMWIDGYLVGRGFDTAIQT